MRKSTVITSFIQDLSYLLDKNISFSINEVHKHIENEDVVEWLEREFPFGSETGLDFSLLEEKHKKWVNSELNSIWGGYAGDERRKWGIEHNGLCLLISWSTEIVRGLLSKNEDWL